jgi:hypothetical protein
MADSDSSHESQTSQSAGSEARARTSEPRGMPGSARAAKVTAPGTHKEKSASTPVSPSPVDSGAAVGKRIPTLEPGGPSEIPAQETNVNDGVHGHEAAAGSNQARRSDHEKVREEAKVAGVNAVKGMWEQAPKLLPLFGVFFYGLGRFVVDGFYGHLNTTADAAGIGYLSIIEPAAVLAAVLAIIGTAIVIVFDVLKVFFLWIARREPYFAALLGILGALVAIGGLISTFSHSPYFNAAVYVTAALSLVVYPLRVVLNIFRNPTAAWSRLLSVGLSLIFLTALCFGAHELGVHEAEKVAKGQTVDMRILGLEMSAINAIPVHIQATGSGPGLKLLFADRCLMNIGSGPFTVLLYDPARQNTLSVPSSEVVVINSSAPCRQ